MATRPYHRWPSPLKSPDGALRLTIYHRSGGRCALNLKGCTTVCTQLDHIIHPNQGGEWFDPHNLRGVCAHCNNKRTKPRHQRTGTDMGHITVVTGPSGAGKTTYVGAHKKPGDTVIDFDELAIALGSDVTSRDYAGSRDPLDYIKWVAYAAWAAALKRATSQRKHKTWLIHAQPKRGTLTDYTRRGATIITINPQTHKPTTKHQTQTANHNTPHPTKPSRQW